MLIKKPEVYKKISMLFKQYKSANDTIKEIHDNHKTKLNQMNVSINNIESNCDEIWLFSTSIIYC